MKHPYAEGPDYRFWRRSVAGRAPADVDPVAGRPLTIHRDQKIVTAGSCFAQHIARYLKRAGYNFLVTEPGHPVLHPKEQEMLNYGVFSARFGNVYTSRQLLQLFDRAYGRFQPADHVWRGDDGGFYDPFRPTIQPGGFPTLEVYQRDRSRHFAAVREAFETCQVFVFTLGLTEAWVSRQDGAAYPICPGTGPAGAFDDERHMFVNLTADEVTAEMTAFISRLREVNPAVRVILTVSPVPLMATAQDEHVLVATTYSKAVLRVAAETLRRTLPQVFYFPSYEIITGPQAQGAYYAEDYRSIREDGVRQVMDTFFRHYTTRYDNAAATASPTAPAAAPDRNLSAEVAQALCDEELLDPSSS